jgi:CIC family chloride channel protein
MRIIHQPLLLLKERLSDKNFLIASSILVGLTSGILAVILKYSVHLMGRLASLSKESNEFFIVALLPLAGILLAIFFTRYYLNENLKKGSANIVYAIVKKSSLINFKECYGHLVTSAFTVGLGGSLGLESPMVSTGSAIGANYGRTYQLSYKERTVLLGCGAAAGIAAAFNSPVAGVLFVIEVLLTDITASAFIPLIISAACGALVSKIILAEGVTLAFKLQQPFNYHNVPYYILLGITCGLVSVLYRKIFHGIELRFQKVRSPWVRALVGGLILFVLILVFPPLFGEGYEGVKLLELRNPQMMVEGSLFEGIINSEGSIRPRNRAGRSPGDAEHAVHRDDVLRRRLEQLARLDASLLEHLLGSFLPSSFTRVTIPSRAAVIFVPRFMLKSSAALSLCVNREKYPCITRNDFPSSKGNA